MGDITAPEGLQALVVDLGRGNVIDAELLEGCPVEAHELDDMDADQAAQVAAHCFAVLFTFFSLVFIGFIICHCDVLVFVRFYFFHVFHKDT